MVPQIVEIIIEINNEEYGPENGSSGWSACCYKD